MNIRRITLSDLAREAGVHVTTVSLCLRNHPRIPFRTRKRIQDLARKVGYMPDPNLQALISYRSRSMARRNPPTLAYLSNWNCCPRWQHMGALPEYYLGAADRASELGFKLKHVWVHEPSFKLNRLNRLLCDKGISGLIVASLVQEKEEPLELDWERFPSVKIDSFPRQPVLHKVINDLRGAVRLVMQQLSAAGYCRIGLVMQRDWDHNADYSSMSGFLWGQTLFDPSESVPLLYFPEPIDTNEERGRKEAAATVSTTAFRRWYEKYRPQVIVSKWSFVEACFAEMGLRIPHDIAFVDLFLERSLGGIAGVQPNYPEVGRSAVQVLADQLEHNKSGIPLVAKTIVVAGTWTDGASCPMDLKLDPVCDAASHDICEVQERA